MNELATFTVTNQEAWDRSVEANQDAYGRGITEYAARWASMVEDAVANGAVIIDVLDKLSHEADTSGITGFMYGKAVLILSEVWTYGETLRRWHNRDIQIGTEGDDANAKPGAVLNPALLGIRKK